MLCVNLISYSSPCGATSGGVSDIWIYDPSDFNFIQEKETGKGANPYSAISLVDGATKEGGARMFRVKFKRKEAEFNFTHSSEGCSVTYEFELSAKLPNLSNDLTNFLSSLDAAGCCCGLGIIIFLNSGKILVLGEKNVNSEVIPYFEVVMNGTKGGSGKTFKDFNGADVMLKGEYSRMAREFVGGVQAIIDLE